LWMDGKQNCGGFWINIFQPVDSMLIDGHESNQRSNNHYRF
jgi:hypothetical protein